MKKYVPHIVIGIAFFLVGILASPYLLTSKVGVAQKSSNTKVAEVKKEPQNKVEAFEQCVTDDIAGKLKIITMPESEKKEGDPIWFGGCNGNWLQPVCEVGIKQVNPMFEESLTSCMYKHLF